MDLVIAGIVAFCGKLFVFLSSSVARTCNLIFIVRRYPPILLSLIFIPQVLDVLKPLNDKRIIEGELEGFGIRLNKKPPSIIVRKKDKGGMLIQFKT